MYNDFVLIGPKSDPAKVGGGKDVARRVEEDRRRRRRRSCRAATRAGRTWPSSTCGRLLGIDLEKAKGAVVSRYGIRNGTGTQHGGVDECAHILADRGTWLSFKNRGDLTILVEGDRRLFNQYGVMLVNPQKHPNVKKELGQTFVDWLISPRGQATIAAYMIDGERLFLSECGNGFVSAWRALYSLLPLR